MPSDGGQLIVGATCDDGTRLAVVVAGDATGLSHPPDWDDLGQRLTASGSLVLDDVETTIDDVLMTLPATDDGAGPRRLRLSLDALAFQAVLAQLLTGIAEAERSWDQQLAQLLVLLTTERRWTVDHATDWLAEPGDASGPSGAYGEGVRRSAPPSAALRDACVRRTRSGDRASTRTGSACGPATTPPRPPPSRRGSTGYGPVRCGTGG